MKSLTKREKVLIFITIILIIVSAGVYFLIVPTINKNMDLAAQLDYLKSEKFVVELALSTVNDKKLEINNLNDGINRVMNELNSEVVDKITRYGFMPNEDIDKLLSVICERNYVYPKNLIIYEQSVVTDDTNSTNSSFNEIKLSINATSTTRRSIQLVIEEMSKNFNFEIDSLWIIKNEGNANSVKKDLYTMNLTCRIIMTK